MPNTDKIHFHYVEACVEVVCAVCLLTFTEFPGYNPDEPAIRFFNCPKCERRYKLEYHIEPQTQEEVMKAIRKKEKLFE